jgi:hypothetical protein
MGSEFRKPGPPVPHKNNVDLLRSLNGTSSEDPGSDWSATFTAKIEGKEKRTRG